MAFQVSLPNDARLRLIINKGVLFVGLKGRAQQKKHQLHPFSRIGIYFSAAFGQVADWPSTSTPRYVQNSLQGVPTTNNYEGKKSSRFTVKS
jgi:hypothetical protein